MKNYVVDVLDVQIVTVFSSEPESEREPGGVHRPNNDILPVVYSDPALIEQHLPLPE